jgi:hypothetical protein
VLSLHRKATPSALNKLVRRMETQGCRFAPTVGLKLANAFGVILLILTFNSAVAVIAASEVFE